MGPGASCSLHKRQAWQPERTFAPGAKARDTETTHSSDHTRQTRRRVGHHGKRTGRLTMPQENLRLHTHTSCRECQELRACDFHASVPGPLPNNLAWDLTSSIISRCDRSCTSSIHRARASFGSTRTSRGNFCDLQLTRAQCLSSWFCGCDECPHCFGSPRYISCSRVTAVQTAKF